MSKPKLSNFGFAAVATLGLIGFLTVFAQTAGAAESSCVTCHLDKEMLQKTVTVKKKVKSAMQSGAG